MKIFVKVKTKAKEEKIEKINKDRFIVWTKEIPQKGRANKAVLRLLADYFNIPISQLEITSGLGSKNKILSVLCEKN